MFADAPSVTRTILLADDAATARAGAALAARLGPGDVVLLRGGLGAGKSALARAAIAALLAEDGRAEDIPSPTFTLAQVYETARGEVWHADLYRLSGPDEAAELGLSEAFGTAICFVEWPERLGPATPAGALTASLDFPGGAEQGRALTLSSDAPRWRAAIDAVAEAAA
jgi:tRNA threonylcarbamoyladenosine biosynthesis protein TsaE